MHIITAVCQASPYSTLHNRRQNRKICPHRCIRTRTHGVTNERIVLQLLLWPQLMLLFVTGPSLSNPCPLNDEAAGMRQVSTVLENCEGWEVEDVDLGHHSKLIAPAHEEIQVLSKSFQLVAINEGTHDL